MVGACLLEYEEDQVMWADGILVGVIMYGVSILSLLGFLGWMELTRKV